MGERNKEKMPTIEWTHTWDLVPKHFEAPHVDCHRVCTITHNLDNTFDKLKARWVYKGFIQTYSLNFTKSLYYDRTEFCMNISIIANINWPFH